MQRPRTGAIIAVLVVAAALAACETRKPLSYDKAAPDPKSVARAPLAVPPDFGIRPRSAGVVAHPFEGEVRDASGAAGRRDRPRIETKDRGVGEMALLKAAGAERIIPDIRRVLDREMSALAREEQAFTDRLVLGEPDATAEESGPIITRREKTMLDRLF